MRATVSRNDPDGLGREVWIWEVSAPLLDGAQLAVTLVQYRVERRPTKRHRKWELIKGYAACDAPERLQLPDVPLPGKMLRQLRAHVADRIAIFAGETNLTETLRQ